MIARKEVRHPMTRHHILVVLACALLTALFSPGHVVADDRAGALFLEAYLKRESALKAEDEGDFPFAREAFTEASRLYDRLAAEFPGWKPDIVGMRREAIRGEIQRVAPRAEAMDRGVPASQAGTPPSGDRLAPAPDAQARGTHIRPPGTGAAAETADPVLQRRLGVMESLLAESNRERDALRGTVARIENRRLAAEAEAERGREERERLHEQITRLRERVVNESVAGSAAATELEKQIAALEEQSREYEANIEEATERSLRLQRELEGERQKYAALEDKLRQTSAERDEMARQLAELRGQDDLTGFAARLQAELAEAQARIAELTASSAEDAATIADLRDRLESVEAQLAAARADNSELRQQLDTAHAELLAAREMLESRKAEASDPRLAAENAVLREIVVQQLRQQAFRSRARDLVLAELAKMEINSRSLLGYIDQLEGKDAMPTPEQIARIRDPYIEALAGVGLSARFFQGDAAADGGGSDLEDALPQLPPEDAREAFEFQKRSLADSAARAFEVGNFESAEETYRLIVEADPGDHRVLNNLGVAILRQERYDEALDIFHRAAALREADPFTHLMMGISHWRLEQHQLAVDRLNRSLTLDPENPMAWLHLGLVALDSDDPAAAEAALLRALEINPDYAAAHYNLAVLFTRPGFANPPEAERRYRRALRLGSPRDPALEDFLRLDDPEFTDPWDLPAWNQTTETSR